MELFNKALRFAVDRHAGQTRKGSDLPYILHAMEAAVIASTITDDEQILCAAILHDTVEDAGSSAEEIKTLFGERVAELVASETENKRKDLPPSQTWKIRKEESLQTLKNTDDIAVKIIWLSDKLSNMRSFYRQYLTRGNDMWESYHQKDPCMQAWYYYTVAECFSELKDTEAYREYIDLTNKIFANTQNKSS